MKKLLFMFVLALVLVSSTAYGDDGKEAWDVSLPQDGGCVEEAIEGLGIIGSGFLACAACVIGRGWATAACATCLGSTAANMGQMREIASACGITKQEGPPGSGGAGGDADGDAGLPGGSPGSECRVERVEYGWTETVCSIIGGERSCTSVERSDYKMTVVCR